MKRYCCSKCNSDIEEKVYDYSKKNYDRVLCRNCQPNAEKEEMKNKKTSRDSFDYNMVKGRIAESLIEQLFLKLKYRVYRYGMENTIPGIMELLRGVKSEVSGIIRRMPDFVIQDKKGEAYFVEVKFSKNEAFALSNLNEKRYGEYPFENAFFIVVSKKHIKCLSYRQLKDGKKISPKCKNYLGNIKEFETDKEVIKEFCKYAIKFFQGV